jgi:ribosome-associated translation inhibitor RaiA
MNLKLRYCGLNSCVRWRQLVENQLKRLQGLATIASARVTLGWERDTRPAFLVQAYLEVPGPDYHAEGRDYTLAAALTKVARQLERQIRSRNSSRANRRKTNLQLGFGHSPGSLRLGGCTS